MCDNCSYEQAPYILFCKNCKHKHPKHQIRQHYIHNICQLDGNQSFLSELDELSSTCTHEEVLIDSFDDNYSEYEPDTLHQTNSRYTFPPQAPDHLSPSQKSANLSWYTQPDSPEPEYHSTRITTQIGYRPDRLPLHRPPPVSKTIKRSNKCIQGLSLPNISLYNMRSLWPKLRNFVIDFKERTTGLCFLNEVWEKIENKKHQFKIEELLHMEDIMYISTPRPGARRGGGAAIVADLTKFSLTKLSIAIPKSIEIVWGLLQSKLEGILPCKIIAISFYSPPNSKKNPLLLDHISTNLHHLRTIHHKAGIIIAGDRNNLKIEQLLSVDNSLKQIVTLPTINGKTLDIIVTSLHTLYQLPTTVQPIPPDKDGQGVPSDHKGVVAEPITTPGQTRNLPRTFKTVRPLPESAMPLFNKDLISQDWAYLNDNNNNTTDIISLFEAHTASLLDKHFPTKTVSTSPVDKPWFTEELRQLKRRRLRIYTKKGKSPQYTKLKNLFEALQEKEITKYTQKIEAAALEGSKGSSYSALRKLGVCDSETADNHFDLPQHLLDNLTPQQSAERIANYFTSISQEYEPLNITSLPPNIQNTMELAQHKFPGPSLEEHQVLDKIRHAKKPHSSIAGDLPVKVIKEFDVELSTPVCIIFNRITMTLKYPDQWKTEYQVPIPKKPKPVDEGQLRNISKTAFFSKTYESFLVDWMLPFINPHLDPGQCGGLSNSSITHYMIKLLHFLHLNLDQQDPHATILALVDMSKAFNRVSHQLIIQDLYDMHIPGWLLCIIASYLTNRTMILSFHGAESTSKRLPGGAPQGALLGNILFIVKFNGAALRPNIPRFIFTPGHHNQLKTRKATNVKFVDDLSIAVSVNLKKETLPRTNMPLPPLYHERTGHYLPSDNCIMSSYLAELQNFAETNLMRINHDKTHLMIFNKSRSIDFHPDFPFGNEPQLSVVETTKLVGIILSSDLSWEANTQYICQRATSRLWLLRRLKRINMDPLKIVDFYSKEVRPLLELAVPAWHSGITLSQSDTIERVQKTALKIILGDLYTNYEYACSLLTIEPLKPRRDVLCLNFAKKTAKKSRHKDLFLTTSNHRQTKDEYHEHKWKTDRFNNSPLPYLTRLLNDN